MTISNVNVHLVDGNLKDELNQLQINADVYQSFRSCYLYHQSSILNIGSFVVLANGNVGRIEEFIFVKYDGNSAKLVRLEMFPFQILSIKDIKTLRQSGDRRIVPMDRVLRKVILYHGENDQLLFVDYDRPTFEFNYSALP